METKEITEKVTKILNEIIEFNIDSFRKEESFKVRPGYGYDKFYLDWVDGSDDMSLESLIYYIMYEEGIYAEILNEAQYKELESVIKEYPDAIYVLDEESENYENIQYNIIQPVYTESIMFVGNKLIELGFDVKEIFSGYLPDQE